MTIGGPSKNKKCIFPFTFDGITYTSHKGCAHNKGGHWCSTKVDINGNHIGNRGNWGFCGSACIKGTLCKSCNGIEKYNVIKLEFIPRMKKYVSFFFFRMQVRYMAGCKEG